MHYEMYALCMYYAALIYSTTYLQISLNINENLKQEKKTYEYKTYMKNNNDIFIAALGSANDLYTNINYNGTIMMY